MFNKKNWIWPFIVMALIFNHTSLASDQSPPVYKGNALDYFANRLPNPMVVYVYSSDSRLRGIIDPHGHTDDKALHDVSKAIASQNFDGIAEAEKDRIGKSLEDYIADQGYDISNIVSKRARYTLLLVLQEVKPTDCQTYADVEKRFQDAIARTISVNASVQATYSLAIIEVGSPKSTITCK
jgi:hypothetical protein